MIIYCIVENPGIEPKNYNMGFIIGGAVMGAMVVLTFCFMIIMGIESRRHFHDKEMAYKPMKQSPKVTFHALRILAMHGAKTTKIRPPGMFCLIILRPDRLLKICMTLF